MVLAGWDRVATFTVVNQTVARNTLGYEDIIAYPVRDFSGTRWPVPTHVSLWDCWAWSGDWIVSLTVPQRQFAYGCPALDVGRALGSCRLLRGAWHRDISKP